MTNLKVSLVIFLIFSTAVAMGQQKVESKFGKGVYVVTNDSSFSMKFNARVQSLLMFEAPANDLSVDGMTSNWLIRRAHSFTELAPSPSSLYFSPSKSSSCFYCIRKQL